MKNKSKILRYECSGCRLWEAFKLEKDEHIIYPNKCPLCKSKIILVNKKKK